jgi:glyoxylase-like metal-dependent hydrolase (beta-lactamase superfamily II)
MTSNYILIDPDFHIYPIRGYHGFFHLLHDVSRKEAVLIDTGLVGEISQLEAVLHEAGLK